MPILGFDQAITNASIAPALQETGWVLSRESEPTGEGGGRETFVKGPTLKLNVAPKAGGKAVMRSGRGQKAEAAERIDDLTTNVITLPAGTEVNERDRIEVEGRGQFEVLMLSRRSVEIGREVDVRELVK